MSYLGALGGTGIGLFLLAVALRRPRLVLPAVALVGTAYAVADGLGSIPRGVALPYGIGLFLLAELGCSVAEGSSPRSASRSRLDRSRASYLALVVGTTLLFGLAALAGAGSLGGGTALEIAGLAVACSLLLAVLALRRHAGSGDHRAIDRAP